MKKATGAGILALAALLFLAGCPRETAAPRNTLRTPQETVSAYCDLDAKGTRLTSTTWSKVLPYISWAEEAGYDHAVVISGFRVGDGRAAGPSAAVVPVTYGVLGVVSGEYRSGRRTEIVRFRVQMTDRGWKIVEPDTLPPHVSAKAMAEHLEATKRIEAAEQVKNDR